MSTDDWFTEKLIRNEALVSNGELRSEVAKAIERTITGNDQVQVLESSTHIGGDWLQTYRERDRYVAGKMERKCDHSDLTMIRGGNVKEVVAGGVFQHASVEGESIVGGAYTGNQVGPYVRMTAFCDFLSWGLWLEADASRIEMAMIAIRAYMAYAHAVGVKSQLAGHLFDDWVNRVESFGTLVDNQAMATRLGGVGSGVEAHM